MIWSMSPKPELKFKVDLADDGIIALAMDQNGQVLSVGRLDGKIKVIDFSDSEKAIQILQHPGMMNFLAMSRNGRTLVSGGVTSEAVFVWDLRIGFPTDIVRGFGQKVTALALSDSGDQELLALALGDKTIHLVNIYDSMDAKDRVEDIAGRKVHTVLQDNSSLIFALGFSADGRTLASGTEDGIVKLWDVQLGTSKKVLKEAHKGGVSAIRFDPTGTVLATGGRDRSVILWNMKNGSKRYQLFGHSNTVQTLAFDLAGQLLASGGADNATALWEVSTGRAVARFVDHSRPVSGLQFIRDGKLLLSGSWDDSVFVRNVDVYHWQEKVCAIANRSLTCKEWEEHVSPSRRYINLCSQSTLPSEAECPR